MLLDAMTAVDPAGGRPPSRCRSRPSGRCRSCAADPAHAPAAVRRRGRAHVAAEAVAPTAVLPAVDRGRAPRPCPAAAPADRADRRRRARARASSAAAWPWSRRPARPPRLEQPRHAGRPGRRLRAHDRGRGAHTATPSRGRRRSRSRSSTHRRRPTRSRRAPSQGTARVEATARIDPGRSQGPQTDVGRMADEFMKGDHAPGSPTAGRRRARSSGRSRATPRPAAARARLEGRHRSTWSGARRAAEAVHKPFALREQCSGAGDIARGTRQTEGCPSTPACADSSASVAGAAPWRRAACGTRRRSTCTARCAGRDRSSAPAEPVQLASPLPWELRGRPGRPRRRLGEPLRAPGIGPPHPEPLA